MDYVVDFLRTRNPFNWTHSKEGVVKNQEGNEGGIQRRHIVGEDKTKEETGVEEPQPESQEGVRHFAGLSKAMADKLEREIEMVLGMAEEGANVTLKTAMQLEIKQRTEEFLLTLHQALTATRRRIEPSGKKEEDQEGEAEAVVPPRALTADGNEGRKGETRDAQEANSSADAITEASRRNNRTSGEREKDQQGEAEAVVQPSARTAESREGRTSRFQAAQVVENLNQAMTATRRSNRTSGKENQEGDEEADVKPSARVADGQDGRKGRSQDANEAKSPVHPLTKAREKGVLFFNKTDEAKLVIEEDRQRQNYQGYSIIGGFSINAILEPIGIAFLEDIFSAMEKARKRYTAWLFNIEKYMGSYSWQHLFPDLYGAGPSTLKCSSKDLHEILDDFEEHIPNIFTTAEKTYWTERLRSDISVAISCILYDKNEYAEVVRLRQLVDEVVEAYSQAIQVPERNSVIDMSDWYFKIP